MTPMMIKVYISLAHMDAHHTGAMWMVIVFSAEYTPFTSDFTLK